MGNDARKVGAQAVKQKQKPYFESTLSHIETLRSPGTVAVSKPVASPHSVDVPDVVFSIKPFFEKYS